MAALDGQGARQMKRHAAATVSDGPCLLVVEDEAQQQDWYGHILDNFGGCYRMASNGTEMRRLCREYPFDGIILDLRLPDVDGLILLREYRRHSDRPVLVVSVRDSAEERAACFNAGATDFMVKPFRPSELLHRLKHLLAGWEQPSPPSRPTIGPWQFNPEQQRLAGPDGKTRHLTPAERNLLQHLLQARGRVLSGPWLQESLELTHRKSVDTLVYRLRQKIEADPRHPALLITVPDRGYCLVA